MIQCVDGIESDYMNHINDPEWDEDDDTMYIRAFDQRWDAATLKQLRDEYNIVFMTAGDAVHPIMILDKDSDHPLLVVGSEDDGTIYFHRRYGQFCNCFSPYWVDHLIADLQEAVTVSGFTGPAMKRQDKTQLS